MIYNGVTFDDFSVIEYVRRQLMPPRNIVVKNTGGVHNHYSGLTHSVAKIEVDVRTICDSRVEMLALYNVMATALATTEPQPLRLRDEPGKYNMAILDGSTDLNNYLNTGFVTLVFATPDPYLYRERPEKLMNVNNIACLNRGGAPANGVVKITVGDTVSSVVVELLETKGYIKITQSFKQGDIITIDLEREDIWLNGDTYIPSDLISEFFLIPPGFFTIKSSTGSVDLEFTERWY